MSDIGESPIATAMTGHWPDLTGECMVGNWRCGCGFEGYVEGDAAKFLAFEVHKRRDE